MVEALLVSVAVGALSLAAAGLLANRLGLPTVLGYLAAGLLLSGQAANQPYFDAATRAAVSQVSILVLLFFIGLELDLARLRGALSETSWAVPFHTLVPLVAIACVGWLAGWSFAQSLLLGTAVAVSSTLLGERLAAARGLATRTRHRILGMLVVEDLLSGILLAVVPLLATGAVSEGWRLALETGGLLLALVVLAAAALLVVPRLLDAVARTHTHELLVLWGLAVVVTFGLLGSWWATAELGAFVAGVAAAEAGSRFTTRQALLGVRDTAIAVFFFASGLGVDILPTLQAPLLVFGVVAAFLVAKYVVNTIAAIAAGLELGQALRCAFAMGAAGEYGLIVAAVADRAGIGHPLLLATVVGVMILALPISAGMMHLAPAIERAFWRLPPAWRRLPIRVAHTLRSLGSDPRAPTKYRRAGRRVVANAILLVAVLVLTPALGTLLATQLHGRLAQTVAAVAGLLVGLPLAWAAFRAYRELAWALAGLRPDAAALGAVRVRMRVVDALVALTFVIALLPIALFLPFAWPVLAVAAALALVVSLVAWRQLRVFHQTLEDAVGRVLGDESNASAVLDHALQGHPGGERFVAVAVPSDSPLANQTLGAGRLAELTGVLVAVLQRGHQEIINPARDEVIRAGDALVLFGDLGELERAEALLVSHGNALRLSARSRMAVVETITVQASSLWCGHRLDDIDVRGETGALVVAVQLADGARLQGYDGGLVVEPGTRLVVLGTRLQVDRVRAVAGQGSSAP